MSEWIKAVRKGWAWSAVKAAGAALALSRTRAGPLTGGLGLFLAWSLGLPLGGPPAALAAGEARLNVGIRIQGFAVVTSLKAEQSGTAGAINLTWTEPGRNLVTSPFDYELRVSTLAQIDNNSDFAAALPLTAVSGSPIPLPGAPGGAAGLVVTGLTPGVTHYFAIRERDSSAPVLAGAWTRNLAKGWNVNNAARAGFLDGLPERVTDLAATATSELGQVAVSWTAPQVPVRPPAAQYILKISTKSVADLAGDTTAWFNLATSTTVLVTPSKPFGGLETLILNGFQSGTTLYFGVKVKDIFDGVSSIDLRAELGPQARAEIKGVIRLTALTGAQSGSIDLSWTEPSSSFLVPPLKYVVRVSSVANISNNAEFAAAVPLSALSSSPLPVPGPGGGNVVLTVTGLIPTVTYYFAIKEEDSGPGPFSTDWIRDLGQGLNLNNFAPAHFIPRAPDPVTNLSALTGTGEGEVNLSWTAPRNQNFVPIASYDLRLATFSAASLGGDTTAWFNLAAGSSVIVSPAKAPGQLETLTVGGLYPNSTYFFAIKVLDAKAELSLIDGNTEAGLQANAMPKNLPAATPLGLAAAAGIIRTNLAWTDLTAVQRGPDFAFFKLYRSTEAGTGFVAITTTTGTAFLDRPLKAFATVYYKISSMDLGNLESVLSSTVSATPFTLPPQEPFGIRVAHTSDTVSFSWLPTERFTDGTPFISSTTPLDDELVGYQIRRSTDICVPNFTILSTMTFVVTSATDNTAGQTYFYQVRSFNSLGASQDVLVLSQFGDHHFFLDDCASRVVLSEAQTPILSKSSNSFGADILISRRRRPEDTGGEVIQSAEFKPLLDGKTELKNFILPTPAKVILGFSTQGGVPVPQSAALGAASAASAPAGPGTLDAGSVKNLGVYWNNGAEFKKMYGTVDALTQTVSVESPNLGVYQLRTLFRASGAVFDLSNLSSRVITPNGDGLNDVLIFTYDPGPNNVLPEGRIYDMKGAYVSEMTFGLVPNTLVWDGRMNGRVVTSGVYVYQIKGDGKVFNGTIVIAR